jgi:uncharacterized protein (DUF1800 family)
MSKGEFLDSLSPASFVHAKDGHFMRTYKKRSLFILAVLTSFITSASLLTSTFSLGARAAGLTADKARRLGEDQKIIHVLNRLGFGAKPGDVEKVRGMGIDRYIDEQLHPERINDSVADSKVKDLASYSMTTAQLYQNYPQPGQFLRMLQRKGDLPPELAGAVKSKNKTATPSQQESNAAEGSTARPAGPEAAPSMPAADDAAKAGKDEEYRRAIRQYYIENNLQPPQKITQELHASRILRAVYSERQLQEQMVDFWSNHFNVFANKGADRWLLVSYDRDTIRPNTMGKFEDLLKATAESPAMLFYLDNFQSVSPKASAGGGMLSRRPQGASVDPLQEMRRQERMGRMAGRIDPIMRPTTPRPDQQTNLPRPQPQKQQAKRGINENYARELMELHTLGVDGGYTQKDVQEVARCFTGWTIFAPRGGAALGARAMGQNFENQAGKFYFNPRLHDDGEKIVLGHKIPAGGGVNDGLMVLDILAHHPSTAKFLATKLARKFVTDNPTSGLVNRIAGAYTKSDGDIRETLRAVFTSPEFNSSEAYRAKIKTPFELAVSAIRALGGETNGGPAIHQWISKMGEPLYGYQAPTGYPDVAENWVNTGALLERLNFGLALASNRIPGTRVDLSKFSGEIKGDASSEKARLMSRFLDVIVQGDISPKTRETLMKQIDHPLPATTGDNVVKKDDAPEMEAISAARGKGERRMQRELAMNAAPVGNPEVVKIVGLILGSPEFQRQ